MKRFNVLTIVMALVLIAGFTPVNAQHSSRNRGASTTVPKPQSRSNPSKAKPAVPPATDRDGDKDTKPEQQDNVSKVKGLLNGLNNGKKNDLIKPRSGNAVPNLQDLINNNQGTVSERIKAEQPVDSIEILKDKAKNGNDEEAAEAAYLLGMYYYTAEGEEMDYKEASSWFKKAHNLGNTHATVMLATCYYYGDGVKADVDRARDLYLEAVEKGDDQVLEVLNLLADGDDVFFLKLLSEIYDKGLGNESIDKKKAYEYTKRAAELGDVDSMLKVATRLYEKGHSRENRVMAFQYFDKVIKGDSTNVDAIYHRGVMLYEGDGVERDTLLAIADFRKAVEFGHVGAKVRLGEIYLYDKDDNTRKKAMQWIEDAASAGDDLARWTLGNCYRTSYMVDRDYFKAIHWISLVETDSLKDKYHNLVAELKEQNDPFFMFLKGMNAYYDYDMKEAFAIFKELKKTAVGEAVTMEAMCYAKGNEFKQAISLLEQVTKDYYDVKTIEVNGVPTTKKESRKAYHAACYQLALIYLNADGKVVKKNEKQAKDLMKTAANAGNGLAQCRYGNMLRDDKKNKDAIKYYQQAEEQWAFYDGNRSVASELAKLYESGKIKPLFPCENIDDHIMKLREIPDDYDPIKALLDKTEF